MLSPINNPLVAFNCKTRLADSNARWQKKLDRFVTELTFFRMLANDGGRVTID